MSFSSTIGNNSLARNGNARAKRRFVVFYSPIQHVTDLSFCFLKVTTPEPEVELTEADLPGLQETVTKLQKEYDDAVVVKHNLENDVRSCSERLKAATSLLHR